MYSDSLMNFFQITEELGLQQGADSLMEMEQNGVSFALDSGVHVDDIWTRAGRVEECLELIEDDNQNDEYNIIIHYDINIEDIFGINDLWNLLFELKEEELSRKLINIIYNIYKNKEETQKIIDKCINIIKDIENITYNKLEKCFNILKYIILESEKDGYNEIKSHFDLLKDCIIKMPLIIFKKFFWEW